MKSIPSFGIARHFRPSNRNVSACGIINPREAAYDGRYADCLLCRKTHAWKRYMGMKMPGKW